jgi:hypothetical protein
VTGVGVVGKVVDRKGYDGVEFIISYGTITATSATITPIIKHGDVTGTMTSVADADLLGTEAAGRDHRDHAAHLRRVQERGQADRLHRRQALRVLHVWCRPSPPPPGLGDRAAQPRRVKPTANN